jgi:SHS2 domain-containing protein
MPSSLTRGLSDQQRGYRLLDHITDAYLEAWGQTIEAAFSSAAEALFDTMLNLARVKPSLADEVDVEGHDEMELLYNWLEALLLKFEVNEVAYSRFQVDPILHSPGSTTLHARILGEKYNREKHGSKTEVKAVTYHEMQIEAGKSGVTVRFLLDL